MASAILYSGNPIVHEYTPDSAATAGDVIVENDVPIVIGHNYDSADTVDNLPIAAHHGGGIYKCTKPTGYTADWCEAAYWNASTGITKTQSDYHFGRFVATAGTNDTECYVLHNPVVGLADES